MDLTGNLQVSHNLCKPVVAFFSNTTLISMQFKFSGHITGPFADPFVDHLTIFVLINTLKLKKKNEDEHALNLRDIVEPLQQLLSVLQKERSQACLSVARRF